MIEVLLVDDNRLDRQAITRLLSEDSLIRVVGQAPNGFDAIAQFRELKPSVVLLDVHLPDISAMEVAKRLFSMDRNVKILIITTYPEKTMARRLIKLGVKGYLTKAASSDELIQAVKRVAMGQSVVSITVAAELALDAMTQKPGDDIFKQLSNREMELLLLLCRGLTMDQIAKKLYLSPKTISTYRHNVLDKLKVDSDVRLVHLAIEHKVIDIDVLKIL